MPTIQEAEVLRQAFGLVDQLQAQWREDNNRDPGPVYAELLKEAKVPVAYLLHRREKEDRRSSFVLILDKPDEDVLTRAFTAEVGVIRRCGAQDIRFQVKQAYSGTGNDVKELIKTRGYAIVQVTDQGKPES